MKVYKKEIPNEIKKPIHEAEQNKERFTLVDRRSAQDVDGFWTDLSLYCDHQEHKYVGVFGDHELYSPEDERDYVFDTEKEAKEWFDDYSNSESDYDDTPFTIEDDITDESCKKRKGKDLHEGGSFEFNIIYDCQKEDGTVLKNCTGSFTGSWEELQAYIKKNELEKGWLDVDTTRVPVSESLDMTRKTAIVEHIEEYKGWKVDTETVWDCYGQLLQVLGDEVVLDNITAAMGTTALAQCLAYTACQNNLSNLPYFKDQNKKADKDKKVDKDDDEFDDKDFEDGKNDMAESCKKAENSSTEEGYTPRETKSGEKFLLPKFNFQKIAKTAINKINSGEYEKLDNHQFYIKFKLDSENLNAFETYLELTDMPSYKVPSEVIDACDKEYMDCRKKVEDALKKELFAIDKFEVSFLDSGDCTVYFWKLKRK